MELVGWNAILFAGKWVLIGLIYFVLFILLIAVRREMAVRLAEASQNRVPATGRLRVLRTGTDSHLHPGSLLPLQPETSLGAATDNDLVLGDRFVSGHHARLRWDGITWWVEDLNSRNGVFVNDQKLPAQQPVAVPPGGKLTLGDMTFELAE